MPFLPSKQLSLSTSSLRTHVNNLQVLSQSFEGYLREFRADEIFVSLLSTILNTTNSLKNLAFNIKSVV